MKKIFFKKINQIAGFIIVIIISSIFGGILIKQAYSSFQSPSTAPNAETHDVGSLDQKIDQALSKLDTLSGKVDSLEGASVHYCFLTQAKYTGNLGGVAGANQKCAQELPGAVFATSVKWEGHAPGVSATIGGWIQGGAYNCSDWSSSSSAEDGGFIKNTSSDIWGISYSANCSIQKHIACCNF